MPKQFLDLEKFPTPVKFYRNTLNIIPSLNTTSPKDMHGNVYLQSSTPKLALLNEYLQIEKYEKYWLNRNCVIRT
jgi:hypothetical protein